MRFFSFGEAASTISCAVMGVLSALMEFCGSEGTCRCRGGEGRRLGCEDGFELIGGICSKSSTVKSPGLRFGGGFYIGMRLLVMLLSISELGSGVGSPLVVSALISTK